MSRECRVRNIVSGAFRHVAPDPVARWLMVCVRVAGLTNAVPRPCGKLCGIHDVRARGLSKVFGSGAMTPLAGDAFALDRRLAIAIESLRHCVRRARMTKQTLGR